MSDDEPIERSEAGNPIFRHDPSERDSTPPSPESADVHRDHLTAILAHLATHVAPVERVCQEIVSDPIRLDVLIIPPAADRPFHVLVTCGMSDLPMTVPEGNEACRRAELLIALPADWPIDEARFDDDRVYWPFGWLGMLGRLPHEYGTWLGYGHSVPNGDPAEPFADTKFVGVMLNFAYWLPEEFHCLKLGPNENTWFYQMVPLYSEEMALWMKRGAEAVDELLEERGIDFVVDVDRPNIAKKKRSGSF